MTGFQAASFGRMASNREQSGAGTGKDCMECKNNLERAMLLQAMSQNGLEFASDSHDISRYRRIRALAAEICAGEGVGTASEIEQLFAREEGYATPKVDVRAAVFRDGQILLVREKSDGLWTLPGGWADVGDSPGEAVEREVLEESGFQTRAVKLLALFDRRLHGHPVSVFHIYKIFMLCEIEGGSPRPSDETTGAGFFTERTIPELSRERVTPEQIALMFLHYRNPGRPADFD